MLGGCYTGSERKGDSTHERTALPALSRNHLGKLYQTKLFRSFQGNAD